MIYIFQGCGAVCKAPCSLCQACGKACDGVCSGCSKACQDCTKALSDAWAPIVQNPLAGYVIGTWGFQIMVLVCVGWTVADIPSSCRDMLIFCTIEGVAAIVHAVFAFYIQRRLVDFIGKEGKSTMTSQEIVEKTKELLKYDVGFCLYVFAFIGAFGYNCYGVMNVGDCSTTGYQRAAVGVMLVYQVGAWMYFVCWYCGQCCYGKAEKKGVIKRHDAAPAPTAVGATQP
mmetsp:Transcript_90181/g.255345  ORF Transcript_90181/g.255345 Transcript_90181/m.255345 type:complete len:229 (+) Transcript_90181:64-750(+)